jgi:hypothetical protein
MYTFDVVSMLHGTVRTPRLLIDVFPAQREQLTAPKIRKDREPHEDSPESGGKTPTSDAACPASAPIWDGHTEGSADQRRPPGSHRCAHFTAVRSTALRTSWIWSRDFVA